jgi:CBS domain-containing protein
MQISEVMTRGVECTRPDATLREAAERMKNLGVGPLPVCENDQLVGILTDRDITVRGTAQALPPMLGHVRDVMTPDVIYCFEDQDVNDAARVMEQNKVRRLVVLDRAKRLAGIVSLGDLAVKAGSAGLSAEALEQISEPASPKK